MHSKADELLHDIVRMNATPTIRYEQLFLFCQKVIELIMDEETEPQVFKIVENVETDDDVIYLQINDGPEELLLQESEPFEIVALDNNQYFYIHVGNEDTIQTVDVDAIVNDAETIKEESIDMPENTVENGTVIQVVDSSEMILLNKEVTTNKKRYKCLYTGCDKVYSTSQHLTVHMRNHVNSKPYSCTFKDCDKKFATNYALTSHWRTHTGEKPYICENCTKSFKTSGDLLKHVRIHTGERPFSCPIEGCGRSFTTSNIRKVHIRSHTGERPYVCDYPNCGKAFASSTNYKNHSRIHSGEKPYVCNVQGCDRKFTEYSSLYKHQAVHQVIKPVECEYCHLKFKSENTLNIHRKCKHGILVSPHGIKLLDMESLNV